MKGTEKQIAWAEDIRNDIDQDLRPQNRTFCRYYPRGRRYFPRGSREKCVIFLDRVNQHPQANEAKFWIDKRDRMPEFLKIYSQVQLLTMRGKSVDEALKTIFGY